MASPLDLRWRLFGIHFCIQPSFWLFNALFGWMMSSLGERYRVGLPLFILLWVLCTLVSVLAHELGHVIMGRIFRLPGNITLGGLGGKAAGDYGALRSWQRLLVIAAGPGAGFLFVGLMVFVDSASWDWLMDELNWDNMKLKIHLIDRIDPNWWMGKNPYTLTLFLLAMIGLFLNILNLIPIIPLDGGMIFKEICSMIAGKAGEMFAFGVSFLLAGIVIAYHLVVAFVKYKLIREPFELYGATRAFPELTVIMFGVMAYQCFQAYRGLAMQERHQAYMEDDDMSGPRHLSPGVEEVPAKDPRDFAPRAPGSERPRD